MVNNRYNFLIFFYLVKGNMEELIVKMGNLNQYADDDVIPVESTGTFDELYDR